MRILPRKAFLFEVGLDSYKCIPGMIQDCPDKFKKSAMYKLAADEGSIELINTRDDLRKAENDKNEGKPKDEGKGKDDKGKTGAATDEGGDKESGDAK